MLVLLLFLFLFSGCMDRGGEVSDQMKPDVNRKDKLLLDPNLIVSSFVGAERNVFSGVSWGGDNNADTPGEGPLNPDPGDEGGGDDSDPTTPGKSPSIPQYSSDKQIFKSDMAPSEVDLVPADIYNEYLGKITEQLDTVLSGRDDVYYRVFSMGVNQETSTVKVTYPAEEITQTVLKPGSIYDAGNFSTFNGNTLLAGSEMQDFLLRYFSQVHKNNENLLRQKAALYKQFSTLGIKDEDTLDALEGNSSFKKTAIYKLWNTSEFNSLTAKAFKNKIMSASGHDGSIVDIVPELELNYYTSASNWNNTIKLNSVGTKPENYGDAIRVSTANTAFTKFNQFADRKVLSRVNVNLSSQGELLKAYVDGYNVTIIYVSAVCENGNDISSLQSVLGADYTTVFNAVSGSAMPADVSAVQASGLTFEAIPAGTKGVR